jgi:putative membrane protein
MKKTIISLSLILTATGSAWGQWRGDEWGMGPWMMGWGIVGWIIPIMIAIFWAAIIIAVIVLIRWAMKSGAIGHGIPKDESALEILKRRYARGEISREEFEAIKKDIL